MSNLVFPSLPGLDIAVKRTSVFATKVQTSASGKELRARFQSSPRYRYTLPMNFLRQSVLNSSTDEVSQLLSIFSTGSGKWDSFWMTDPVVVNLIKNGDGNMVNPGPYETAGLVTTAGPLGETKIRSVVNGWTQITPLMPITPSENLFVHFYSVAPDNTGYAAFAVDYMDINGAYVSSSYFNQGVASWTLTEGVVTAPANARYVRILFQASDPASHAAMFSQLWVCQMVPAGLTAVPDGNLTRIANTLEFQRRVRFDMDELEMEQLVTQCWTGATLKFISVK